MTATQEKQNKVIAGAITIAAHLILLSLLFFTIITTPIPPFPAEKEGLVLGLIGFGNENKNDLQPKKNVHTLLNKQKNEDQKAKESVITNETEKSIRLENNKTDKNRLKTMQEQPGEPTPSKELLNAIAVVNQKKGRDSEGPPSSHPNKYPDPKKFKLELPGREIVKLPDIVDDSQEEGKVVVEIIVDASGKVIAAEPGQRGSTSASSILFAKARQAALSSKFNPSPDGAREQRGSMTFVFILN